MEKVTMNNKENYYPVKVLEKSFLILDLLHQNSSPISITEISKKLSFYTSTVYRILCTLKSGGFVEQDTKTQKYLLGMKFVELGASKLKNMNLTKEIGPYLKELKAKFNETVHLGILRENEILYLLKEESSQTIRMVSQIGNRAPIYCTGLGKILLAFLPSKEKNEILNKTKLIAYTNNTITNRKILEDELSKIKKQGFAIDDEEHEKDVFCIAVPVTNFENQTIAAISISIPKFRINFDKQEEIKEVLINTSDAISKRLRLAK